MSTVIEPQDLAPTDARLKPAGLLASYRDAASVTAAARSLVDEGYQRLDVHSPYPLHGIDEVLRAKKPALPFAALIGAAIGLAGGIWMAWWMNAIDYPFIISGKPLFSILPSLPVAFELAILLAAFAVFGGALLLAGLPKHSNRLFRVPGFARATDDRFFLAIDATDKRFKQEHLSDLLERSGALQVSEIPASEPGSAAIPRPLLMAGAILGVIALIPPVMIAKARSTMSDTPQLSLVSDMDHQPKFKTQTTTPLFADGRAMRPQVSGTIARGDLRADSAYYLGYVGEATKPNGELAEPNRLPTPDPVNAQNSLPGEFIQKDSDGQILTTMADETSNSDAVASADVVSTVQWVDRIPISVDAALLQRGRQRYEIYCATCHGIGGDGDGLVTLRALELEQGTWVRPTSLHAEPIRNQPNGKLYNTISNGIRKMPGYSSQIPVADRWAIVAYLRALQRTRTSTVDDVPADVVPNMREIR